MNTRGHMALGTSAVQRCAKIQYLVEWAIASHGMYESALDFYFNCKQKNLYIVAVKHVWAHLGHKQHISFFQN